MENKTAIVREQKQTRGVYRSARGDGAAAATATAATTGTSRRATTSHPFADRVYRDRAQTRLRRHTDPRPGPSTMTTTSRRRTARRREAFDAATGERRRSVGGNILRRVAAPGGLRRETSLERPAATERVRRMDHNYQAQRAAREGGGTGSAAASVHHHRPRQRYNREYVQARHHAHTKRRDGARRRGRWDDAYPFNSCLTGRLN